MNTNALIILNGDLNKNLVKQFIRKNKPRNSFCLIAADGSSNNLFKYKIVPDYIIGDLDSSSRTSLNYFSKKGSEIVKINEQDHNDFEKCLIFSTKKNYNNIVVLGYGGGRIDHLINNLSVLNKYSSKCRIKLLDESYEIIKINKSIKFIYKQNEPVSLIALPKASGIKTKGLKYKLNLETLEFGKREGALNNSTSKSIKVEYKTGSLFIIKKHFGQLNF